MEDLTMHFFVSQVLENAVNSSLFEHNSSLSSLFEHFQ